MKLFRKIKISLLLIAVSAAISFGFYQIGFVKKILDKIELTVYDARFVLKEAASEPKVIENVVIIDIDEKSIDKLGRFSSWPLLYFGEAAKYAAQGGALSIAFDFFFTEPDQLDARIIDSYTRVLKTKLSLNESQIREVLEKLDTEEQFADALKISGNTILAAFDDEKGESASEAEFPNGLTHIEINKQQYISDFRNIINPKFPIEKLRDNAHKIGFAHIYPDEDGISRRFDTFFEYKNQLVMNFSMQMIFDVFNIDSVGFEEGSVKLYSHNNLKTKIPVNENGSTSLNFYGKQKTFRYISFSDVLRHRIDSTFFKDKLVIFGASAIGLHDLKTIPYDSDYPGPELHATFVQNAFENNFLFMLPRFINSWIEILIIVFSVLLFLRLSIKLAVSSYFIFSILLFIITYMAFADYNYLVSFSIYFYFMSITFFTTIIYRYSTEVKEKQKIKNAFSKYVTNSIVDDMLDHPEKLVLGGEIKNVTALFSDIKNFTNLSEKVSPTELTDFLKKYMTDLTDVILKNNGMLDKYIGDSIVALFGAPIQFDGQAKNACISAIKMKRKADEVSLQSNNPYFKSVFTRIGINTGEMIVGNMGSEQLFDYTGIGDNMNLASRLEGLNKYYGTQILISESTKNALDDSFLIREIDKVAVKGKTKGVRIFELYDTFEDVSDVQKIKFNELKKLYEEALMCYYEGNWQKAIESFESLHTKYPDDFSSNLLLERSKKLAATPPENWEGVIIMDSK